MKTSEKVQKAFENALQFGDSEEVSEGLKADFEVFSRYVSWDEFDTRPTAGDHHKYDLKAIVVAAVEIDNEARATGRQAFALDDDGNGCHVFFAYDENVLVSALLTTAAKMEDSCHV